MTLPPEGKIRLNIHINPQVHAAFKAASALERKPMGKLVVQFIEAYLKQRGLHPQQMEKGKKK